VYPFFCCRLQVVGLQVLFLQVVYKLRVLSNLTQVLIVIVF